MCGRYVLKRKDLEAMMAQLLPADVALIRHLQELVKDIGKLMRTKSMTDSLVSM